MKKLYSLSLLMLCCVFMASTLTAQNAPIDFETGSNGASWTWTVFENGDNPPVEITANPDASGANTSTTVAKFTARTTGNPWAGTESMHGADIGIFSLTPSNSLIKIMVYKTTVSDVGIKLVNAGGGALPEIKVANTLINQWEELTFDFSSQEDGAVGAVGPYDQIVVFPDFTFDPRPQDNIVYFDNITFNENSSSGGCTDPVAQNFDPGATSPDGSCIYLVTFVLDMNQYGGGFNTPEVNGEWNDWCGGCQQLFDGDGDGVYSGNHFVPEGEWEYKFAVDGWADSEPLVDIGGDCTITTPDGAFTNRIFTVSTNQTEGVFCWNSCEACSVLSNPGCTDPGAANYDPEATDDDGSCLYTVTFNVDMNCESEFNTVGVTGPFVGWCGGCFNLSDTDGDGIYSGSTDLPSGSLEYKYEINSFGGQENLIDDMQNGGTCAPITDYFSYANRLVDIPMGAVSFDDTYGSCDPCVPGEILGCTDPSAVNFNPGATLEDGTCQYAVTFVLNMNQYDGTFGIPEVNGQWNGWCGGCQQLSDPDGDNIWEGTHVVPAGANEYKFAVDGWSDQEFFDPGTSCTVTDPSGAFTNRVFTVTGVQTEGPYCWEECEDCIDPCQQSLFPTAPVNLDEDNTNLVTLLSWNSVPASLGCQVQGNKAGSANYPTFLVQGNAPDGMPVNNSQLINGATYQWRVRCGCSASPLIVTPWSDWKFFTHFAQVETSETDGILKSANVYPNPNSGEFDLTIKGNAGEMIELNIYDVLGNQIQNKSLKLNSDQNSFNIEIENKIKGIYFVDITTTSSKITKKIVIE